MEGSIKQMLEKFKEQNITIKLIVVNVVIFLLLGVLKIFFMLFELSPLDLNVCLAISSNVGTLLTHFWTIITYMFVHYDIWHILFNMLMLYVFGRIFLLYFTSKNLLALYFLGGISGGIFYVLAYNTIPFFISQGDSSMIGASASVMSIIFASAFYDKNLPVNLLFFGSVKIVYVAVAIFILDFIALGSGSNMGGHIAHIGGAAIGYVFASRFLKGHDITKVVNNMLDKFVNVFKRQPKMKVTYGNKHQSDYDYNSKKKKETDDIDSILDKIKQSGYSSLSSDEKKRLFDASNK